MEHWRTLLDNFPYIGLMAGNQRNRPYFTRLFEQALPGVMVGVAVAGLSVWKSDAVQDNKIQSNTDHISRIDIEMDNFKKEMNQRFDTIEQKIDYALRYRPLPNYGSREK